MCNIRVVAKIKGSSWIVFNNDYVRINEFALPYFQKILYVVFAYSRNNDAGIHL